MEGLWVDDVCKAGEMKDFGRDQAIVPTPYPIPDVNFYFILFFSNNIKYFYLVGSCTS